LPVNEVNPREYGSRQVFSGLHKASIAHWSTIEQ
jgi:hypothetical protein